MRVLKWMGIVSLPIALIIGYMFITAFRSGWWLDRLFLELSQDWNAEVIIRNAGSNPAPGLQTALNDLKRMHLEGTTNAACTHGPNYEREEGFDFRSRCILWGKFDAGVVRFEFHLKGFWDQWKIIGFRFLPEASGV
jgi:hypothetical protein